jgi:hypothetical protein
MANASKLTPARPDDKVWYKPRNHTVGSHLTSACPLPAPLPISPPISGVEKSSTTSKITAANCTIVEIWRKLRRGRIVISSPASARKTKNINALPAIVAAAWPTTNRSHKPLLV